jgi:LysM repeat protein
MKAIPSIAALALSLGMISCADKGDNEYDTPIEGYDTGVNPPADSSPNPVYDSPAVYEDSAPVEQIPTTPPEPTMGSVNPAAAPASPNAPARIHTVVAGDTLSGISAKYKVPMASIKAANRMTTDVVVLGRKMVIPPQ